MNKHLRQLVWASALVLAGLACAHADAVATPDSTQQPLHLSAESPVRGLIRAAVGNGPYSYRFVVRDPRRIDRPYRNGPYQIELTDGTTFPSGSAFYDGTADERGRTAVFRFAKPVGLSDISVQPVVGKGAFGQRFQVTGTTPNSDLSDMPYMIDDQAGRIYCGRVLPQNRTVRYLDTTASTLSLYTDKSHAHCLALEKRINGVMSRPSPLARIGGMRQLLRDPRLESDREMVQNKIDALVIRFGTLNQVKAVLQRQLAPVSTDPAEQADRYNSMAYDLLTEHPPRFVDYANELLDRSLALDRSIYNMDSKGWALHLLGRDEEALEWINRSLALFKSECTDSERAAYPEGLAHQGLILWSLKRQDEALTKWAMADLFTSNGGWTNFIPPWQRIEPLIKQWERQLKADGYVSSVCRTEPSADRQNAGDSSQLPGSTQGSE